MSRLSDQFGQEAARRASKAATDALWAQDSGVCAYRLAGKIFIGCGVAWGLLSLIPILCKTPLNEWLWMWILAAIQIIPGTVFLVLTKKSERFRVWASRDFRKGLKKKEHYGEKVRIGKSTLPMTYGDLLALKILGVMAAILLLVLLALGRL